ncbi:hypothetical protein, conserved [Eimeria necatrix]|uniref:PH domain-containing protein n=1 Tax=Eimeria necatrix TaxID=51315 RepID=U6N375_9EIME|nr:hypothetical protein, conserved [Eimeria necatrix]CDJ69184.1 hypothetical protein, conserved [Eimeria necatrix]
MGNSMSCFERWGKRAPDGALFAPKKRNAENPKSPSVFAVPTTAAAAAAAAANGAAAKKAPVPKFAILPLTVFDCWLAANDERRASKEAAGLPAVSDENREVENAFVQRHRQSDLLARRQGGRVVQGALWRGRQGQGRGVFITSVKAQQDNPKGLTINVNNPSPTTFSFTFKTKEERESWEKQLESLQKFMAMI